MSRRKHEGPTIQELRSQSPEALKLPPHKKPKVWRLVVKYTRTTTETCEKEFTSKGAMQEFRARVEREEAKEKAKPPRKTYRWWGPWWSDQLKMDAVEHSTFTEGPVITEEFVG